jgi:hypothetical protein
MKISMVNEWETKKKGNHSIEIFEEHQMTLLYLLGVLKFKPIQIKTAN